MFTKKFILLFLIILYAVTLRFWDYSSRYGIGYDGSRDALVAFESARQLQLPLTGSFSSVGPITFGPWYYYYITFSNFLIPSKWAPWISIGLASAAMVYMMYLIGIHLLGRKFGLILAFMVAISPAQVLASVNLQQHALIGFLSSVCIYLFILHYKQTSKTYPTLWGFVTGLAINTHFQAVGLLTLPLIAGVFFQHRRFLFRFILGFFMSMIPILTFELNNHWFNTKNTIDYVLYGQYRIWTSNRWLTFITKFWPEFWSYVTGLPLYLTYIVGIAVPLCFIMQRKKIPRVLFFLTISFIMLVVMLRYYRGEKFFGYLQFFHPYIFIYTSLLIYFISKNIPKIITLLAFIPMTIGFIVPNTLLYTRPEKLNQETHVRIETLRKIFPNTKFSTIECGKVYDVDRIQGLMLFLYMYDLYDEHGRKITIANPSCPIGVKAENDIVDLNVTEAEDLLLHGLRPITPDEVWTGTARWWFKEQP